MAVRLEDREFEAMAGLSDHAFRLYVTLRRHMDFGSGLVGGPRRRISLQSLREELYVEPGRGIQGSGAPTKSKVRRTLQALERAGLVVDCSDGRNLVFELRLASSDSSAPKKTDTNPTQTRHRHSDTEGDTEADTLETAQQRDSQGEADTETGMEADTNPTRPYPPEPDTPPGPVSGEPPTPARAPAREAEPTETPATVQGWVELLVNRIGYHPNQAWSPKAVPVYRRWMEAGVTAADVMDCAQTVQARKGTLPPPTYLADMAVEMRRDKEAAAERGDDANTGGTHGPREQGSRPQSAFDRVMAGAEAARRGGQFDE